MSFSLNLCDRVLLIWGHGKIKGGGQSPRVKLKNNICKWSHFTAIKFEQSETRLHYPDLKFICAQAHKFLSPFFKIIGTCCWLQILLFNSQQGRKSEKRFLKNEPVAMYKSSLVLSPSKEGMICKVCPSLCLPLRVAIM